MAQFAFDVQFELRGLSPYRPVKETSADVSESPQNGPHSLLPSDTQMMPELQQDPLRRPPFPHVYESPARRSRGRRRLHPDPRRHKGGQGLLRGGAALGSKEPPC